MVLSNPAHDPFVASASTPVMLVTADADLIEALLRLAAAADTPLAVMSTIGEVRGQWARSSLVLVGIDQVDALIAAGVPRRIGVHMVQLESAHQLGDLRDDSSVWRRAVELGVETVVTLPAQERLMLDRLIDTLDGTGIPTPVIAVVGGCGGAGASTLAAGLAALMAQQLPAGCLLVDADPIGGGLELLCEAEKVPGLRWGELLATRGRVSADALRHAVPVIDGVCVVSHDRTPRSVHPEALDAVVAAGPRGFGLTVIDVGRGCLFGDAGSRSALAASSALARATLTVVVVPADLFALAATDSLLRASRSNMGEIGLVVRHRRNSDLDSDDVARALGLPLMAQMSDARSATAQQTLWAIARSVGLVARRTGRRRAA